MAIRVMIGDCFEQLALLPDDSVDCVVTSPPYWGLRDYGVAGQIGMEKTLGEHLEIMVILFREVRRVLKTTGTCWINYGDCYATSPNGRSAADTKAAGNDDRTFRDKPFSTIQGSMKAKDLCMIPNRIAIALQDDGWWIRSEIIWHKPNPMPESITDRPATAHEKIWLVTKSKKYFYNAEAVRVPMAAASLERLSQDIENQKGSDRANGGKKHNGPMKAVRAKGNAKTFRGGQYTGNSQFDNSMDHERDSHGNKPNKTGTANLKNVWSIPTRGFSGAHFATFPTEIPETCIKAGCPKGGVVLDPFGGAGTTALVADRLGFDAILIELNPDYVDIAVRRISNDAPLFVQFVNPQPAQRGAPAGGSSKPRRKKKMNIIEKAENLAKDLGADVEKVWEEFESFFRKKAEEGAKEREAASAPVDAEAAATTPEVSSSVEPATEAPPAAVEAETSGTGTAS